MSERAKKAYSAAFGDGFGAPTGKATDDVERAIERARADGRTEDAAVLENMKRTLRVTISAATLLSVVGVLGGPPNADQVRYLESACRNAGPGIEEQAVQITLRMIDGAIAAVDAL